MKVAGLDALGDWQFGRSKSTYIQDSEAIAQNVVTRLKEFKGDWYANTAKGIDWISLLGARNTRKQIENEVRRVVLQTQGVASLDQLEITVNVQTRRGTIRLAYTDIFSGKFEQEIGVAE